MTSGQRSTFISNWQTNWITGQVTSCPARRYQNNYCWGYLRNNFEWGVVSYWENTTNAQASLDYFLRCGTVAYHQPVEYDRRQGRSWGRHPRGH